MPRRRHRVATAVAALLLVLGVGGRAFADPAGPTDYRSEILAVEPPTPSIRLDVLGGDSFVELEVEPGTEVIVLGYRSEDYLWFRSDGIVFENRNSPTTYQNQDRFGGDAPAFATPDAEPDWVEVGSGGRWAWHDHRAHWMQPIRPAGRGPGDRIVEAVIPLRVDGDAVGVTVASTWLDEPSAVPVWFGGVAAAASAAAAVLLWRRRRAWAVALLPLPALAAVVGAVQYLSLPAETGPRPVWWVLPAMALLAVAVAVVATRRRAPFVVAGAALVAGVQLVVWGWVKRDGIAAAIVPTDAPGWLDRGTTAAAIVGGLAISALALWDLFGPRRPAAR